MSRDGGGRGSRAGAEQKSTTPILLVGSAVTCPDLEYASGFRATDPVVFLQTAVGRFLVVPPLEYGRASRVGRNLEVLTPELLGVPKRRRRAVEEWAWRLLRREAVRRVAVPRMFPHGVAAALLRRGVRVAVAAGEVFPGRAVKTAEEQRKIAAAQQAAVIAMRAAVDLVAQAKIGVSGYLERQGGRLTAEQVRSRIEQVLLEHGCFGRDTIVAGGMAAADPHEIGHGPLAAHEAIVIDIFPQHLEYGYWGDLTRTVARGAPAPALRRMYQAVRAAQTAALSRVRAGARCESVHRAAVEEFRRRGFETRTEGGRPEGFIHGTGHGVGLSIHEAPGVAPGPARLRAGNVITVEPGLYYPGVGGVRLEDTVVVTAKGWRYLAPCEKRFEVGQ